MFTITYEYCHAFHLHLIIRDTIVLLVPNCKIIEANHIIAEKIDI